MPRRFGARSRFRRRRFQRRGRPSAWSRGLRSVGSIARQVWRLKGLVNSEMYKLDLIGNSNTIDTAGGLTHLSSIAQGDGDGQRTGNSVFVRSINIRGVVYRNAAGASTQVVRLSVIMDTQQVGDTSPTFASIYEGTDVNSHLNSDTVGRFKVLKNLILTVDSAGQSGKAFLINLPMRHHVRWNGTASTDIQKGGLYFSIVSASATNAPTVTWDGRVSYHDN